MIKQNKKLYLSGLLFHSFMRTIKRSTSSYEAVMDTVYDLFAKRAKELTGYILLFSCGFLVCALATWSVLDPSLNNATNASIQNVLGWPGAVISDLLMQLWGLGSLALIIPPLWWGWRLVRKGKMEKPLSRILLWAVGSGIASMVASSLPTTTHWPLPTGLGGIVGDGLLNAIKIIFGMDTGSGSFVLGALTVLLAILTVSAACSLGVHWEIENNDNYEAIGSSETDSKPSGQNRPTAGWDDEIASSEHDEPGLGIISLGALIHAFMSLRARIRRWKTNKASAQQKREDISFQRQQNASRVRVEFPPPPPGVSPVYAATGYEVPHSSPAVQNLLHPSIHPGHTPPDAETSSAYLPFAEPDIYDDISENYSPSSSPLSQALESASVALAHENKDPEDSAAPWKSPLQEFTRAGRTTSQSQPATAPIPIPQIQRKPEPALAQKPAKRVFRESQPVFHPDSVYELPSHDLLLPPKQSSTALVSADALEQNATLLESTLEDFGVRGEITHVRPGPVVTLYELEPAPGTKSSRVIGLSDDIARSMSAISARVAVVQGRNAMGIELPNARRDTVYLRELLAAPDFISGKLKLALCLGKGIGGEPVIVDLAKMPHLLIAGTTGSGKSVAINTMILSLLYRLTPEQCRLIMVDPKMLELSVYDGIPHLLTPVVTDPQKAVIALKWAVREMDDRYRNMSKLGVRNIDGFNTRVREAKNNGEIITRTVQTGFDKETGEILFEEEEMKLEPLPYIVVIVDEMADLMLVAGKEIEVLIQRLAQKARAAGIHVILATQRPSVDVITGTIKANFPTRISFQVSSKIDSRTILGEQGAEQLLGQGDMLYMAGGGRLTRVHGPFCSDEEVEKVVAHLKTQAPPDYLESVTAEEDESSEGDGPASDQGSFGAQGGDLYDQAVALVLRDKKASTSYVQRRLQIGYNRAATLIERMEKEGVISPANHAGKREILLETREYMEEPDDE